MFCGDTVSPQVNAMIVGPGNRPGRSAIMAWRRATAAVRW
jgi:hypothetical protein